MPKRWLRQAAAMASKSTHMYRLGAVAIRGRKVCGRGYNKDKSHASLRRQYNYYSIHAEAAALSGIEGADAVVVTRLKADGSLSMSKPCSSCLCMLKDKGVSKVYYTDWNGNIQSQKI